MEPVSTEYKMSVMKNVNFYRQLRDSNTKGTAVCSGGWVGTSPICVIMRCTMLGQPVPSILSDCPHYAVTLNAQISHIAMASCSECQDLYPVTVIFGVNTDRQKLALKGIFIRFPNAIFSGSRSYVGEIFLFSGIGARDWRSVTSTKRSAS